MRNHGQPGIKDFNAVIALLASAKRKKAEGDLAGAVHILISIFEANPDVLRAPRDSMNT